MEKLYRTEDTICALCTPPGTGALAIIRVSGSRTYSTIRRLLRQKLPPKREAAGRHFLRTLKLDDGVSVEAVLICFQSPHSFTGEDVIEISLPGNTVMVKQLLQHLVELGARPAEPGEFSFRACVYGRMDLAQAEAVNESIRATSEQMLRLSLNQLAGETSHHVQKWLDILNNLLARVEVVHDYPGDAGEVSSEEPEIWEETASREELRELGEPAESYQSLQPASIFALARLLPLAGELDTSISLHDRYGALRRGLKVVIVGPPNVGKSTLFNRLLGFERAIVAAAPGTTRDYLEESLLIGGVKLSLVDTAGLRHARHLVEMLGVERAQRLLAESDALILMEDAGHFYPDGRERLPRIAETWESAREQEIPTLVVINKADTLSDEKERSHFDLHAKSLGAALISAIEGTGVERVVGFLRELGSVGDSSVRFLLTDRQRTLVVRARQSIEQATESLRLGLPLDVVSIDLYDAQKALAQILSMESHQMVIEQVFSQFCVGK
ncbi:MAG: hypothetical protein B1H03_00555 [Planctomycetales bacterium 4484_113]|nr:MAG: hypothetical protein B1H03_00555 [Planctomycetales bacterium 4484_113]